MSTADNAYMRLRAFVNFYRDNWNQIYSIGGCPMLNAATEADDHLLFLQEVVKKYFMIWHKRIVRVIEEGKAEAAFKAETNSDQYAYTIMMLIEGGVLLSRTLGSTTQL
ncbi:TetR family transcriptional regulator C-terminal domain-containing protein, partial [Elizabethkingia anophelis]